MKDTYPVCEGRDDHMSLDIFWQHGAEAENISLMKDSWGGNRVRADHLMQLGVCRIIPALLG